MSRSAADATRFTATSPHAYSKPPTATFSPSSPSRVPRSSGTPPNTPFNRSSIPLGDETPHEKVARLRHAARMAKEAQVSQFDKIVIRGRVWADRAHRVTALGLIGATGIAGAVAIFALGDMIIYNRRKRRDYFAEQSALHKTRLAEAKVAAARGAADEDQMLLINRERAADEAERARSAKNGVFKRTKEWLFSGLKNEEGGIGGAALDVLGEEGLRKMGAEAEGTVSTEAAAMHPLAREVTTNVTEGNDGRPQLGRPAGPESKSQILKAVDEKRREGERALERQGAEAGSLDRLAENTTASTSTGSREGWTSWVTGK
ncbi:MAG: hypothetical protein M1830_005564 [Pleopsidium flavum]|nr:MAG: hypothetical protein M1830_005564 [Pleopsidium flavum]